MQSIAEILSAFALQGRTYKAFIDNTWLQGRTVFGGLVTALANHAMRQLVPAERSLRSLQTQFIGPNSEGDIELEPVMLRAGKAVALTSCTVRSRGEVTAVLTAAYGAPRKSMLNIYPSPIVISLQPDQIHDVASGLLPAFTQHYFQRWARGDAPYSRSTNATLSVYVRYRDRDAMKLTEAHVVALMDAIPSPALALLDKPSPASTLSWTLEMLDTTFDFGVDEWWRLDASVDAAADGYVVHTSHVVNPAGRVAAISRQVVVVYG